MLILLLKKVLVEKELKSVLTEHPLRKKQETSSVLVEINTLGSILYRARPSAILNCSVFIHTRISPSVMVFAYAITSMGCIRTRMPGFAGGATILGGVAATGTGAETTMVAGVGTATPPGGEEDGETCFRSITSSVPFSAMRRS